MWTLFYVEAAGGHILQARLPYTHIFAMKLMYLFFNDACLLAEGKFLQDFLFFRDEYELKTFTAITAMYRIKRLDFDSW